MSILSNIYYSFAFLTAMLFCVGEAPAQEKLSVFSTYQAGDEVWMKYTDNSNALYHHIASLAQDCLSEREKIVSRLITTEDWNSYLHEIREKCFSNLSAFIKTPLNAKITGKLNRGNYNVEKVVFESVPGFYVSACIFIPTKGKKPFPAVLVAIGHSQAAFRRDFYQHNILNLVNKGFIVLTYDPIGQGERVQYYDISKNKSFIGGSVFEHSYAGAQSLLAGNSISDNFIWDGVRALDYLLSRPDVNPAKIGMTGISGGGTQTAFLSAYDKRIYVSAPEAYITGFQRLFESIGPQDAEQNMYQGLKLGIDHADLLSMRAPMPTMVISTTQDFFSIQGARETVEKAKHVFISYGKPANLMMVEANGEHGSEKENREKMYSFFQEHLMHPGSIKDEEVAYFSEKELTVTATGQVSTEYNSKSIFDLNSEKAVSVINKRSIRNSSDLIKNKASIIHKIREISAYDSSRSILSCVFTGKVEEESYKIEKYFIQGKDFHYPIPFVLIKPYTEDKRKLLLYLTSTGKDTLLNNKAEIEKYISMGFTIVAPDLIGTGELKNSSFKGDSYMGFSYNIWFAANLVGQSIPGLQASDLDVLFKTLRNRQDIDFENITSIVKDEACSSYLHFAVFNNHIKKTILVNPLISYEELIFTRNYTPKYIWTAVPGALKFYDLPYLEALLAPRDLIIINPITAKGEIAGPEVINQQYLILSESYKVQKAAQNLKILQKSTSDLTEFLK